MINVQWLIDHLSLLALIINNGFYNLCKYTKTFPKCKTLKKFLSKNFELTKKIYLFS